MEREVARVAAACALRAFRYIPFLALKFDPIPIASESEVEAATAAPALEPPPAAIPVPTPVSLPEVVALTAPPLPAGSMIEQASKPELVPAPAPAPIVINPPPPVEPASAAPVSAPPGRRYRMLEELAPASEPEPEAGVVASRPAGRPAPRPAMPALPGGAATRPSSSALHSPRPRGTTPRRAWPG